MFFHYTPLSFCNFLQKQNLISFDQGGYRLMVGDETTASGQKGVMQYIVPIMRNLISVMNQSAYHLRSNDGLLLVPGGKLLIFFCCCSHMVQCITHLVKEIQKQFKKCLNPYSKHIFFN